MNASGHTGDAGASLFDHQHVGRGDIEASATVGEVGRVAQIDREVEVGGINVLGLRGASRERNERAGWDSGPDGAAGEDIFSPIVSAHAAAEIFDDHAAQIDGGTWRAVSHDQQLHLVNLSIDVFVDHDIEWHGVLHCLIEHFERVGRGARAVGIGSRDTEADRAGGQWCGAIGDRAIGRSHAPPAG